MLTFAECLFHAANTPELVREFDRLSGTHLSTIGNRPGLHALIDEATGRDDEDVRKFVAFVFAAVWLPLTTSESSP